MQEKKIYVTLGGTFNMVRNDSDQLEAGYELITRLTKRYIYENIENEDQQKDVAHKLDNIVKKKLHPPKHLDTDELLKLFREIDPAKPFDNYEKGKEFILSHYNNPEEILLDSQDDLKTDSMAFTEKEMKAIYSAIESQIKQARAGNYKANIKFLSGTDSAAIYIQYVMQRLEKDFSPKELSQYCSIVFASSMHPADYEHDTFFNVKIDKELDGFNTGMNVAQVTRFNDVGSPIIEVLDAKSPFIKIASEVGNFIKSPQEVAEVQQGLTDLGIYMDQKGKGNSPLIIADIFSNCENDSLRALINILNYSLKKGHDPIVIPVTTKLVESISGDEKRKLVEILQKCSQQQKAVIFYQPYDYAHYVHQEEGPYHDFQSRFDKFQHALTDGGVNQGSCHFMSGKFGYPYEFIQSSIAAHMHHGGKDQQATIPAAVSIEPVLLPKDRVYICFPPIVVSELGDAKKTISDMSHHFDSKNMGTMFYQLADGGINKELLGNYPVVLRHAIRIPGREVIENMVKCIKEESNVPVNEAEMSIIKKMLQDAKRAINQTEERRNIYEMEYASGQTMSHCTSPRKAEGVGYITAIDQSRVDFTSKIFDVALGVLKQPHIASEELKNAFENDLSMKRANMNRGACMAQ